MRIAIVIENGLQQLVLTPETEHETACLAQMHSPNMVTSIFKGAYYECQGGWYRQGRGTDSTIVVLRPKPEITLEDELATQEETDL